VKLSRLISIAVPTVLMSAAAVVLAETGTIISPDQAPAPVVKPRDDAIAEQERRRAESERKRANEERRRREAAEQAVARLKNDAARSQRQRQAAQQERKRAEEERRRREAAEQTLARLKNDAAESARQRERAEQERKRADEERRRREATEQTLARLKADAAADAERQRHSAEQERRRADEERGRREAAEQNLARLKTEAAESERQREASRTVPKPLPLEYGRADEQRANVPARDWRRAEAQPNEPGDRSYDRAGTEAGRLDAMLAGAELRRDCDACPRVVAIPPGPLLVASVQVEQPRRRCACRRGSR
jgi:hypothetical protein